MMPKVDGVKVLNAIRNLEKQKGFLPEKRSKVIMITALAETHYVQKAFEIGCDGYAAKPVDLEKMIKLMEQIGFVKQNKPISFKI